MQIGGIKLKYFVIVIALIAFAAGIWMTFFQSRGFEKATATIVSIEEVPGLTADSETDYTVTVEYDVNGTHYREKLDSYAPSYKVGGTVDILYDPQDPSVIHSGGGFGIYLIIIGAVLLAGVAITSFRTKKALQEQRETHPETSYAPSVKGEERHLYFLTDTGTAKVGHRIEDGSRRVLYEAKVTKFTLTAPTGMDFVDHEHIRTTPHLVGHREDSEYSSIFIDNHSTFTFDGEDIWKHLKKNGVSVESGFQEGKLLWPEYRVFRDGEEMARVESSSMYVHEEDAEAKGKLGSLIPARGFYRIWTREENLDLLFVVIMAFARTEANDDKGGNFGLLFGRKNKN